MLKANQIPPVVLALHDAGPFTEAYTSVCEASLYPVMIGSALVLPLCDVIAFA